MDGEVEDQPDFESAGHIDPEAGAADNAGGEDAEGEAAGHRRSAYDASDEGLQEEELEDLDIYTLEELKLRKALYTEAVKRREAAEVEAGVGNRGSGDEMQGVRSCRGRTRVLSGAVKRKRTLAAERQLLKLLQRMSSKYGVTGWVFGYLTGAGKPRVGAAESMQSWWLQERVYETKAIRAHVAGRGELQREMNGLEGAELKDLLCKLNGPQLHSLAAAWFLKCSPSVRRYPLDLKKGCPPWWPEDVPYKKTALMKNEALREAVLAALRNICTNGNSSEATAERLQDVFTTSRVLSGESARVRAVIHVVVNKVVLLWPPVDSTSDGDGPQQADGDEQDNPGGTAGGQDDEAADIEGVGGRRKRRRRCDITDFPYKCVVAGCEGHRGFVNPGGLVNHLRTKHPGVPRSGPDINDDRGTQSDAGAAGQQGAADRGAQPSWGEGVCAIPACEQQHEEGGRKTNHKCGIEGCRVYMHIPCYMKAFQTACDDGAIFCAAHRPMGTAAHNQSTRDGVENTRQEGDAQDEPQQPPSPPRRPPAGSRQGRTSAATPIHATYSRRRTSNPRWRGTARRTGTRKGRAEWEDIRRRVTSATSPSLEGMKHEGQAVFISHLSGWRKGDYVYVHNAPLRVLTAVAEKCGIDLVGLTYEDKKIVVENFYWNRYYDELIDNRGQT